MTGFGNTPLGADQIPLGTANVPGTVDPVPIQGSTLTTTDGNNNKTTPVNLNLKQVGDVLFALGQALKIASIPVTLASDQGNIPISATSLPLPTGAATQTTLANVLTQLQAGIAVNTISNYATETGGNLASAKADLDTLAGIVSGGKGAVKAGAGDFADLATLAAIVSGAKAAIKAATNDIVDLATLLARHNDTFGTNTAISAATTFSAIPLVSALAANSYATLPNASYMATFSAQINVASAFVGTIGFYGLLPDGTTLQQINAHQRGTASNGNSSAINTGSALEQTWEGSIAAFKAIYVVCTAFTSGAASVQIGLTAADYAHAIINTVAGNITQVGGTAPQLDGGSSNRLGVSLYGKNSAAGDTSILLDSIGRQLMGVSTSALFTTAQVTVASNNSGDIDVSKLREISIDITMTLITTNIQFFWERKGADGNYYPLWQTAVLTSTTNPISTSVGPGLAYNQSLGTTGRFRWVATGNASFTPNVYGK